MEQAAKNTDREIYRQPPKKWTPEDGTDRGMEPTVFVTDRGAIGMCHYGKCAVKTIEEWVKLAWNDDVPSKGEPSKIEEVKEDAKENTDTNSLARLNVGEYRPSRNAT